jgi:hypothetical protein
MTVNLWKRGAIAAAAGAALAAPLGAQSPRDACTALLPTSLVAAVEKEFPAYRLPVESDNLPEDVSYDREHGGSGCLGVAMGDFHGKDRKDYALLLTSRSADQTVLIVATRSSSSWHFDRLRDWGDGRSRLYVATIEKGSYEQSGALHGTADEPGELLRYASKHPGVVSGATESSGVAYFFTGHRWVHVWISD